MSIQKIKLEDKPDAKLKEYLSYIDFELKLVKEIESNIELASPRAKKKTNKTEQQQQQQPNELESELEYHQTRLKCLFERAIGDNSNCLNVSLWLQYTNYLNEEETEATMGSNDTKQLFNLSVYKRAIRNCPWSSKLWINYTLLMERRQSSTQTIKQIYNESMNAGLQTSEDYLQIWHSYIDYLKRLLFQSSTKKEEEEEEEEVTSREEQIENLRDSFQKGINQLYEFFKFNGDPLCSLEKHWALVEAKYLNNIEGARKIWNERIINKPSFSLYASEWLEFLELEKEFGDEKHQRKVLTRALHECQDKGGDKGKENRQLILETYYKFEKLNGNVHQFNNAFMKLEHFKQKKVNKYPNNKQQQQQQTDTKSKFQNDKKLIDKNDKRSPTSTSTSTDKAKRNLKRKLPSNELEDGTVNHNQFESKDKDGFAIPSLPFADSSKKSEFLSFKKSIFFL
jgi:squamous cell carcinoma antigen recognized by T-cells 3